MWIYDVGREQSHKAVHQRKEQQQKTPLLLIQENY